MTPSIVEIKRGHWLCVGDRARCTQVPLARGYWGPPVRREYHCEGVRAPPRPTAVTTATAAAGIPATTPHRPVGIPFAVVGELDGTLFGYAADGFEIHYVGSDAQSSWQLKAG